MIAWYLLVQGVLGAAWWLALLTVSGVKAAFFSSTFENDSFHALMAADLPLFVGGSLAGCVMVAASSRGARPCLWFLVGVVSYACLWSIGYRVSAAEGTLSVLCMSGALIATVLCAIYHL